ncbi:hypothetical protein Fmac_031619 [Flemingia macrophylla]|uniref:Uncharacterized protein n=1 Tax=Flemingia macrophylla TaxID=520843 RepID=A0ABD1L2K4_9FABA
MEKKELVETNEASPPAVGEEEGDSFTIRSEEDWVKHLVLLETQNVDRDGPEFGSYIDDILDNVTSEAVEELEGGAFTVQSENHEKESKECEFDNEQDNMSNKIDEMVDVELSSHKETNDNVTEESQLAQRVGDSCDLQCGSPDADLETSTVPGDWFQMEHGSDSMKSENQVDILGKEYSSVKVDSNGDFENKSREVTLDNSNFEHHVLALKEDDSRVMESAQMNQNTDNTTEDNNLEPVVGGSQVPSCEVGCSTAMHTSDTNVEAPGVVNKAISLRNFVREKSIIAVSIVLRHLSGKRDEYLVGNSDDIPKDASDLSRDSETREVSEKTVEKTTWNPLNYMKMSSDVEAENKTVLTEEPITEGPPLPIAMKGRVLLYTRLGCQECKEVRKFLYMKRLRYVEINIDVYPSRNMELEKNSGSTSVPKVFFNEILIGGLSLLKSLNESGKLNEKIDYLINEAPSFECPVPPLSGEDDASSRGTLDEMALIVRKMKECIVVKDRFYKMRRFPSCFLGSDAVDFLSEDQYLERREIDSLFCNEVGRMWRRDGRRKPRPRASCHLLEMQWQNTAQGSNMIWKPKSFGTANGGTVVTEAENGVRVDASVALSRKSSGVFFILLASPSQSLPFSSYFCYRDLFSLSHSLLISVTNHCAARHLPRPGNCLRLFETPLDVVVDELLLRVPAVEFARKLASKLFFQHVLHENLFEDGNHLYRFLDDDPIVASLCYNIPRGIITLKPKPMTEVASRLRLLSYAMFEAYASEDGRHVDYRSIHGSEEFARYLRTVEELQRGEIWALSREEKLAFFINLYNMMTIHAILVRGHPSGVLERRKLFADFKYVIGASTYSLSAIQNGILRTNQRPPYTLTKLFSANDNRLRVALPFHEPLIHFALVYGTRSGPALRCYSPGDIDKELVDAARSFLRSGGLSVDFTAKIAYASKILKWFSVDFGKNEVEVLKHVSNYLEPADSELLLDLLATSELKVIYQPYDWGLNC